MQESQSNGRGDIIIDIVPFQADPNIVDIAIRGGCKTTMLGDSDFSMYV